MASLAQLLAHHRSILVLDAASTQVQVGMLRSGVPAVWHSAGGEAGQWIFAGTDFCLRQAGLAWQDVGAVAYCEGPGSMLGIRTVAMALRTWQAATGPRPLYSYQSLVLLAAELARTGTPAPFSVIADARRDTWHTVTVDAQGRRSALQRLPSATLAARADPLWLPGSFRAWAPPPRATQPCDYEVSRLLAGQMDADLFTPTESPDAFQHEAPEYKRWTAQVHSAAAKATR